MPTLDVSIPEDIIRKDLTDDEVAFLKQSFGQEAPDHGLVASFKETRQADGLTTLVTHFARPGGQPPSPVGLPAAGTLAWGAKVSAAFRDTVRDIASELGTDPDFLMAAMAFETGRSFSASQPNLAGSGAVGLIQFMPNTAKGLGTDSAALTALTPEDQLAFVRKYFTPFKGRLHNLGDVYMAILFPVAVSKPDDFVLFSQSISPTAFHQNAGLDVNGDGKVTKAEATIKVQAMLTEGLKPENIG